MKRRILYATIVAFLPAVAVGGEERGPTDIARVLVESLARGDFAGACADFDDSLSTALPAEGLREAWEAFARRFGALEKITGIRREKWERGDVVFVMCKCGKGLADIKVVTDRSGKVAGLFFLPPQVSAGVTPGLSPLPGRFTEKEVRIGSGEWVLPGTLTLPAESSARCGVVLVHGSGPHDRDESIGPNKPFRDLAWGLASRGIAVLRYDKRTAAHAAKLKGAAEGITVKEETIDDALAAVAFMRGIEGIDPRKVFVLGHSLGGMLIPRIGKRDQEIAGFVILAGSSRPLEEVILEQVEYIFSLDGDLSADEKAQLEKLKSQIARVKDPGLSPDTPSGELPLGIPARYWLDLRGYNPAEEAKGLKAPMLVMQGGRDYQVTEKDFDGWKKSLSSRPDVTFKYYPKFNHLFVEGERKCSPEELLVPRPMDERALDDIAAWVKERAKAIPPSVGATAEPAAGR